MVRGIKRPEVRRSQAFAFLYGSFDGPGWSIPYFTMSPKFQDAADALKTTSDLPDADQQEWKLEGLFQRDIQWPRVENEIRPYLRQEANPAFFNSITIAMVPYDDLNNVLLDDFSSFEGFQPPQFENPDAFAKLLNIGPIALGWYEDWNDIQSEDAGQQGAMQWNLDQVHGIAIDGQHRLAAIKQIMESPVQAAKFRFARVPVIVLIFDKRLGFRKPEEASDRSLLELVRSLFVDLNKHARQVHRTRVILLEDGEPHARCVREVLTEGISKDIADLFADEPRLPISLADWHSENAKFDKGPYLTSVLQLDWIVSQVLGRKNVSDYMSHNSVVLELATLQRSLALDLRPARDRVKANEQDAIPFGYTATEVNSIASAFRGLYTKSLCHMLSAFRPYKELINLRLNQGSFGLEFQHWHFLDKRRGNQPGMADHEYHNWITELAGRPGDDWTEDAFQEWKRSIEGLKDDNLAFNVNFQKAYFSAWLEYRKYERHEFDEVENEEIHLPDGEYFDEVEAPNPDDGSPLTEEDMDSEVGADPLSIPSVADNLLISTTHFVDAMNRLVDGLPDILRSNCLIPVDQLDLGNGRKSISPSFWGGSLYKTDDQTLDYTQAASDRAKDLLFMIVSMITFDNLNEPDQESVFEDFWLPLFAEDGRPGFLSRIKRAVDRQVRPGGQAGLGARILGQQERDYDEDLAKAEIEVRLKYVWDTIGL